MTLFTAYREFDVLDGKAILGSGEIRYVFAIKPGRKAVTRANASEGSAPAEDPQIDLQGVAIRMHQSHPWRVLDGAAFDAFSVDVPDAWFLEQAAEAAE